MAQNQNAPKAVSQEQMTQNLYNKIMAGRGEKAINVVTAEISQEDKADYIKQHVANAMDKWDADESAKLTAKVDALTAKWPKPLGKVAAFATKLGNSMLANPIKRTLQVSRYRRSINTALAESNDNIAMVDAVIDEIEESAAANTKKSSREIVDDAKMRLIMDERSDDPDRKGYQDKVLKTTIERAEEAVRVKQEGLENYDNVKEKERSEETDEREALIRETLREYAEKVAAEHSNAKPEKIESEKNEVVNKLKEINGGVVGNYRAVVDQIDQDLRGKMTQELGAAKKSSKHRAAVAALDMYLDKNKVTLTDTEASIGLAAKNCYMKLSDKSALTHGVVVGMVVALGTSAIGSFASGSARTAGLSKLSNSSLVLTSLKAGVAGVLGFAKGYSSKKKEQSKQNIADALKDNNEDKWGEGKFGLKSVKAQIELMSECSAKLADASAKKADRESAYALAVSMIAELRVRNSEQNKNHIQLLSYDGLENVELQKAAMFKQMNALQKQLKKFDEDNKGVIRTSVDDMIEELAYISSNVEETKSIQKRERLAKGLKTGAVAMITAGALGFLMKRSQIMSEIKGLRNGDLKFDGLNLVNTAGGAGVVGDIAQPDTTTGNETPDDAGGASESINTPKTFEADRNGKNLIFADTNGDGKAEVYLDANHDGILSEADIQEDVFGVDANGDGSVNFDDLKIAGDIRINEQGIINAEDLKAMNAGLQKYGFALGEKEVQLDTTHETIKTMTTDEYLNSDNVKTETFTSKVWDSEKNTDVYLHSPKGVDYDGDGTIDAWRINVTGNADKISNSQLAVTLKDELGKNTVATFDIQTDANGTAYAEIPYGMAVLNERTVNTGKLLADYVEVAEFGGDGVERIHSTIVGNGEIGSNGFMRMLGTANDIGTQYDFCALNADGTLGESFGAVEIPEHLFAVEDFIDNGAFDDAFHEQVHYTESTVTLGNGEVVRDVDVRGYNPQLDQYYAYEGSGENGILYEGANVYKNKVCHFGLAYDIRTNNAGEIINQGDVLRQQLNGIATTPEIALTYATSEGQWLTEDVIEKMAGADVPGLNGLIDTPEEFNIVTDLMRSNEKVFVGIANETIDRHLEIMNGGYLKLEGIGVHHTAYTYNGSGDDLNVGFQQKSVNSEQILACYDKNGVKTSTNGTMGQILGGKDGATDGFGIHCGSQPKDKIPVPEKTPEPTPEVETEPEVPEVTPEPEKPEVETEPDIPETETEPDTPEVETEPEPTPEVETEPEPTPEVETEPTPTPTPEPTPTPTPEPTPTLEPKHEEVEIKNAGPDVVPEEVKTPASELSESPYEVNGSNISEHTVVNPELSPAENEALNAKAAEDALAAEQGAKEAEAIKEEIEHAEEIGGQAAGDEVRAGLWQDFKNAHTGDVDGGAVVDNGGGATSSGSGSTTFDTTGDVTTGGPESSTENSDSAWDQWLKKYWGR